jgi:hypothetical protein
MVRKQGFGQTTGKGLSSDGNIECSSLLYRTRTYQLRNHGRIIIGCYLKELLSQQAIYQKHRLIRDSPQITLRSDIKDQPVWKWDTKGR